MTLSPAAPAPVEQILDSLPLAGPIEQFRPEPRCRVCRNDELRRKVNDLLATGVSYAFILRSLSEDNAPLDERARITIDSIRNHCARHFPVQNAARATYRQILERRAEESRVDFIQGIATALTPMAYFEVVMNAGFRRLLEDGGDVSVDTGLRAAEKLQSVLDKRDPYDEIADVRRQVNLILDAVKTTVPEEMWGAIADKIDELHPPALSFDDETAHFDEGFEPDDYDDFDDEV